MPPQEQTPMHPMGESKPVTHSLNKSITVISIAFVVLLILCVYVMRWSGVFTLNTPTQTPSTQVQKPVVTQEKVIVKGADLTKNVPAVEKIPVVFSKDVPLAKDAVITESNTAQYPEKGITQSTFSYTTALSQKDAYLLYESYMTKMKYVFGAEGKKPNTYLFGVKNNDDLTIVIASNGKQTTATVVFLDRK